MSKKGASGEIRWLVNLDEICFYAQRLASPAGWGL